MAVLDSYTQLGQREDLSNVLTRVAVEETPFLSAIGKSKASNTLHEWMEESLDAPAVNRQIEGFAATFGTEAARSRLNNYCQISSKTASVSNTVEALNSAGISSEYAHRMKKKTVELARDMERAHWQGSKDAGATATGARGSGGVFFWVTTNRQSMSGVTGADVTGTAQAGAASTITLAVGDGAGTADGDHFLITGGTGAGQYRVQTGAAAGDVVTVTEAWDVVPDATSTYIHYTVPVALTEDVLNDGIQSAKDAGGNPNAIYVSGSQKRAISGFATGIRRVEADGKTLGAAINVYDSDFGPMAIKYDRWTPAGTAAILDEKMFSTAFLRPVVSTELAKVGSSRDFLIEAEYCLESRGETASSIVAGISL